MIPESILNLSQMYKQQDKLHARKVDSKDIENHKHGARKEPTTMNKESKTKFNKWYQKARLRNIRPRGPWRPRNTFNFNDDSSEDKKRWNSGRGERSASKHAWGPTGHVRICGSQDPPGFLGKPARHPVVWVPPFFGLAKTGACANGGLAF